MVYRGGATGKVEAAELPQPEPAAGQVRIKASACGVCRTDLHVVDGDLRRAEAARRAGARDRRRRRRRRAQGWRTFSPARSRRHSLVGKLVRHLPILPRRAREPLRAGALHRLSDRWRLCGVRGRRRALLLSAAVRIRGREHARLWLCAGLIGHRSYRMAGDARRIGLYGFGAAAHIVTQVAVWEGREVYAFTRGGDQEAQGLARRLGAAWAGASDDTPPEPSTPRFSSPRSAVSSRRRCVASTAAARSSAPAST